MAALHCPECGFANPEGANYCQKCGAYLGGPKEGGEEPTTMTYRVDETGEMKPVDIDEVVEESGAALVIRSGGGRAGESFSIADERVSIAMLPVTILAPSGLNPALNTTPAWPLRSSRSVPVRASHTLAVLS